jgi:hypothetical protein
VQLPATRPFVVSGVFLYPKDAEKLTIIDAAGRHDVEVLAAFPFGALEREQKEGQDFIAYQQIGAPNCMIAPADAMVPMIYSRGFGPGSYAECKAWIDKNCGRS